MTTHAYEMKARKGVLSEDVLEGEDVLVYKRVCCERVGYERVCYERVNCESVCCESVCCERVCIEIVL